MTREEYNEKKNDLTNAKWEFNAFATYKRGEKYRVQIDGSYMGDYMVRVTNRGKIGLELRKGSPEGEKIAYLPALKTDQELYVSKSDALTLFPVYVVYNKSTQEITTLKATDMFASVMVVPRPAANPQGIQTVAFPNDPLTTWETILGTLKSPVAYVRVENHVVNQAVYFTNSGGTRYYSQDGYNAIGSGESLMFDVEGADADDGGAKKNFIVQVYNGVIEVAVRMEKITDTEDEEGNPKKETTYVDPVIENGYEYSLDIDGGGNVASGYTAILKKGNKRDLSKQIESL
jgi:hypothetical protein